MKKGESIDLGIPILTIPNTAPVRNLVGRPPRPVPTVQTRVFSHVEIPTRHQDIDVQQEEDAQEGLAEEQATEAEPPTKAQPEEPSIQSFPRPILFISASQD